MHRLFFSGNLFLAHGAFIKRYPLKTLIAYADALSEAGTHRIDINPTLTAWEKNDQETIAKYDGLIAHIRRSGLQVVLNPTFLDLDAPRSFEATRDSAAAAYADLARRYKPDVFTVVHEPGTMNKRMREELSPKQWGDFARSMAEIVKRESPKTRCSAGVLPNEMAYFKQFIKIRDLDLIGLDIYALKALEKYDEMIRMARTAGKAVYIEETWRPAVTVMGGRLQFSPGRGIGNREFEDLDSKWLTAMTLYASVNGLEAITPFWTPTFFRYNSRSETNDALSEEYLSDVAGAVLQKERSSTYLTYKRLIREHGHTL